MFLYIHDPISASWCAPGSSAGAIETEAVAGRNTCMSPGSAANKNADPVQQWPGAQEYRVSVFGGAPDIWTALSASARSAR